MKTLIGETSGTGQMNPHMCREGHTQFPEKVNVWASILDDHNVGPIFIDETLPVILT